MSANSPSGDLRLRRVAAGLTQLELAVRAGVAPSSLRLFEAGYQPRYSPALEQLQHTLDQIEAGTAATEWKLTPGVGVSGFRDDRDGPQEAA